MLGNGVIIIAFSWIPPAIVAYVVREREAHHNSKHQQLISGVSIFAYWTSNFLWDVCLYVLPLAFTILFLWLFGILAASIQSIRSIRSCHFWVLLVSQSPVTPVEVGSLFDLFDLSFSRFPVRLSLHSCSEFAEVSMPLCNMVPSKLCDQIL
eukprot:s4562_g2.t1